MVSRFHPVEKTTDDQKGMYDTPKEFDEQNGEML
jgi:hypothetical protein